MATTTFVNYGLYFANAADGVAAQAANGGSLILNLTPESAIATYPLGQILTEFPGFGQCPGTVVLGTYTPVAGTPGINWNPNNISTSTLTTSVTETVYGTFLGIMATYTVNFTWSGTIIYGGVPLTLTPIPVSFTGKWEQQVLTYTGDGNANHAIATTFSLASGVVVVRIYPSANNGPTTRHNAMTGSTESVQPADAGGITGFTSTGFTVTDDLGQLVDVNQVGHTYTAIVLRDSTSDNRYIRVGQYAGDASASKTITLSAELRQLTQVWVFGRSGTGVFCSDDFTVGNSVSWGIEAKPVTNQITSLGVDQFGIGNDNNVNNNGIALYYYVAFSIPIGNPIRNIFQTFKSPVGAGGAGGTVSLNFTPTFAMAREYTVNVPSSVWRGPLQLTTHSTPYSGAAQVTTGIIAFGVNQLSLGTVTLPDGENAYGFAMITGSTIAPVVVNIPPPNIVAPLGLVIAGSVSSQWLLERAEAKYRSEENL